MINLSVSMGQVTVSPNQPLACYGSLQRKNSCGAAAGLVLGDVTPLTSFQGPLTLVAD
jgi:hypothetical protein